MAGVQQGAYDYVRDGLRAGFYKPNTDLNINELAVEANVSLIPMREALARLSAEGLIERRPAGGFSVPGVSVQNLVGDYTVIFCFLRQVTELGLVQRELFPLTDLDVANDYLARMREDVEGMVEEAREFTRMFYRMIPSPKFISCVDAALDSSEFYRRVHYRDFLDFDAYLLTRENYADAMRAGDARTARNCVQAVWKTWLLTAEDVCRQAWFELYNRPSSNGDLSLSKG